MIRLTDVWHHYGVRPVLRGIDLHVAAGQLVAVMGPNGMGKSTLLGVIAGTLCPMRGTVEIAGKLRRSSIDNELAIRRQLVYLPEPPYLPRGCTGREFVVALGQLYGVEERRLFEHMEQLLELFDLAEKGDAQIDSYSTGQRKKIAVCAALATEAPLMVLDEPFSGGLDSSALLALGKVLERLAERSDVTVVMAVPVPELVESLAHRVAVVADGRLVAYDTVAGICRAGAADTLAEALEKLLDPQVHEHLEAYLRGRDS